MDDAVVYEPPPPSSDQNSVADFQFSAEMESLAIPPLDPQFFSSETFMSDLGFGSGDNCDFDLTFDDLDDLFPTSDSDGMNFLIPDGFDPIEPAPQPNSASPGSSAVVSISGDLGGSDVSRFLNSSSLDESARRDHDQDFSENSVGPKSSISEAVNSPSNSGNSGNSKVTVEDETAKICLVKRKKDESDLQGGNADSRSAKYRRSSDNNKNASFANVDDGNEEEEKRKARLMRNRESAQLSRQRKKHYVDELEDKVRSMHSTIADLNTRISYVMAENATLKHQLSSYGGGGPPPPPSGMYPMPPMPYPWLPYSPYVVNPQRSQVPLVPIPRLNSKKSESKKKAEGKTKKVASISFLGLLFFILLFGGLVPLVNVKFGGLMDRGPSGLSPAYFSDGRLYDEHKGRVLTVHGRLNGSEESIGLGISGGKFDVSNKVVHRDSDQMWKEKECGHTQPMLSSDEFRRLANNTSSDPLSASLYVPRNDRLVKIDGNLIIHSVLASEKAKGSMKTSSAVGKDLVSALAIPEVGGNRGRHAPLYPNPSGPYKVLTAGSADVSKDRMKSTAGDSKLQQWFREGLAGPTLSSGMCTEVFQFDVSAAIVPASSVSNVSEHRQNSTELNRRRNRRILGVLPSSNHNVIEENVTRRNQLNDNLPGNRSVSSMVVSVLVDPREAGDNTEVDGMINPKSLSRIFVVVLLDSVKYVTYSCVLPRSGPHLVTT